MDGARSNLQVLLLLHGLVGHQHLPLKVKACVQVGIGSVVPIVVLLRIVALDLLTWPLGTKSLNAGGGSSVLLCMTVLQEATWECSLEGYILAQLVISLPADAGL